MTGNGKLLIQFLKNVETIVIPVYQRNYDWKIEHCRKLFQDLCSTIQKRRMHFFGGIVSVSDPMGGTFDFLIIDGQQRLTTISLLVLAMANLIRDGKVKPNDPYLYDTLTKKFLVDDVNPNHHKLKLKPIKGDRSAYEKLFGHEDEYEKDSNNTQNYLYFYNEIPKGDFIFTPLVDDVLLVFGLDSLGVFLALMVNNRGYVNSSFLGFHNTHELQPNKQGIICIAVFTHYRISRPLGDSKISAFLRTGSLGIAQIVGISLPTEFTELLVNQILGSLYARMNEPLP